GVLLTKALLDYISGNAGSRLQWLAPKYMRYLLGDQVSDMLAIPESTIPASFLMHPLKYWNQARSALDGYSDTYYDTRTMYRKNTKKLFKAQEVRIGILKNYI